jgi:hypothetical protein
MNVALMQGHSLMENMWIKHIYRLGFTNNDLMLSEKSSDETTKLRLGIIPDLHIRRLTDGSNDETIIGVKTLGPGESYKSQVPTQGQRSKASQSCYLWTDNSNHLKPHWTWAAAQLEEFFPLSRQICTQLAKVQAADYSHLGMSTPRQHSDWSSTTCIENLVSACIEDGHASCWIG